jgi:hypothetical protein
VLAKLLKHKGFDLPAWVNWKTVLIAAVTAAILSSGIAVWLNYLPLRDVATRYAPMAEAFAEGNWDYAFHPRVPPLQVICGGIIAWLFNCNGFIALKITSAIWFTASIFMCFALFNAVDKERKMSAALAALCLAFYPYAFHMGYSGLRESAKTFLLLLIAYALVKIHKSAKSYSPFIWLGLSCGLSAINRQETIPLAFCCLFFGAVEESLSGRFPRKILISSAITFLFLLGNTLINRVLFNVNLPDCRLEHLCKDYFGSVPTLSGFCLVTAALLILIAPAGSIAVKLFKKLHYSCFFIAAVLFVTATSIWRGIPCTSQEIWEFLDSLGKGFYRFAGLFAFLSMIYLICRNKLNRAELWILATLFASTVLSIGLIHIVDRNLIVPSRYLFTAMPLLFGVMLAGIKELFDFIARYSGRLPVQILSILLICGALYGLTTHMTQPLRRQIGRKRNQVIRKMIYGLSDILKKDYDGAATRKVAYFPLIYNSCKAPKIYFYDDDKICVSAYFAGGSPALFPFEADYYIGVAEPPEGRTGVVIGKVASQEITLFVWRLKK